MLSSDVFPKTRTQLLNIHEHSINVSTFTINYLIMIQMKNQ